MTIYRTSEVAKIIGLHPNTIRKYEAWGLIPQPQRLPNGYRIYTDFHVDLIKLSRKAFHIELLHSNLRRTMVEVIKAAAKKEFISAQQQLFCYQEIIDDELEKAQKATEICEGLLLHKHNLLSSKTYSRKAVAELLGVSVDALRNWELNGLLQPQRQANGRRYYTSQEVSRIRIIKTLRDAKYSLEAILRMLNGLKTNPAISLADTLNRPDEQAEIISVCDQLITSLQTGKQNAQEIGRLLGDLEEKYGTVPLN